MYFEKQLLFFFSAIGAFNGLFLSLYFGLLIKNKTRATYFLAALLFVISVRVTKSVFLSFYPEISSSFVSVGLTACFLIGPFTYLYARIAIHPEKVGSWTWIWHVIPVCIFMVIISVLYPYAEHRELWWRSPPRIFGSLLFAQWTIYGIAAFYQARISFRNVLYKSSEKETFDYWIVSILMGCFLVWLAYNTTQYTSYVVGAISFTFIFYITFFFWFLRRRESALSFLSPAQKYGNKKITKEQAEVIKAKLEALFEKEALHLNPELKLGLVAEKIELPTHELSQFLNDNLGLGFTHYVNAFRIEYATALLQKDSILTLEAIGQECGFKSNSSFYAAFKKVKGVTPAQFKRSLA